MKKIGLLVGTTLSILILMSTISMQMFCHSGYKNGTDAGSFEVFPLVSISLLFPTSSPVRYCGCNS